MQCFLKSHNYRCSQLILQCLDQKKIQFIQTPQVIVNYGQNQNWFQILEVYQIHNFGFQQQWVRFARLVKDQGTPTRINNQIKAKEVRVKLEDDQSQVMSTADAIILAKQKDMDLIETVPHASPPVCIIMEYNKFRYEQQKKEKELKKNLAEKTLKDKQLQFTYNISPHDLVVKQRKLKELLDRKSTRLNSSHEIPSRMPSSA
eukprot:TRINITY_DN1720_c0_g1_i5.p1 TRINITY_DN1720_c0_g1~~TRINITY_DN1720_c0_g1_i5.p1  ORF type:complete len:214 (+),score=20.84 TRINITY_DN1720_c0_g1_i5:36-644(+)